MSLQILDVDEICVLRGQALTIEIEVKNLDGTPADLSGGVFEFGFSENDSAPYQLERTPTSAANVLSVPITAADYSTLTRNHYYFSSWVTIAGNPTPVARGFLRITNDPYSL